MITPHLDRVGQAIAQLPSGWRVAPLGKLCSFLDSRRIPVNDIERKRRIAGKPQADLFPYYGANGQVGWIDDYIFDEPLILLAEDGGNFGSEDKPIAYSVSGRYWVNNHAHVLRPNQGIDFDYLLHALRIRPDLMPLVSGSTRDKLNQELAAIIPVPLPPTLADQKRIATILNDQMAAVEKACLAAEARLAAARALPAAIIQTAFNNNIGSYPKGQLGKCVTKIGSGITPSGGQSVYQKSGIPLIRSQNVHLNQFVGEGLAYVSKEMDVEMEGSRVYSGDVLLNITGASIGRVCVVPSAMCPANVNQHVSIIRCTTELVPDFLSFYLSTPQFQKLIMNSQAGATRQALTKLIIENFEIPIPPLDKQLHLVKMLNKQLEFTDTIIHKLENELMTIGSLPAAIMRLAFTGGM